MAQAGPGLASPVSAAPVSRRPGGRVLAAAAAVFGLALAAYAADVAGHPLRMTLTWFDLNIYNNAGLITRHAHAKAGLYTWQFVPGMKYLYTPFAALGFAAASLLPWTALKWLMTAGSIAAMVVTAWLAFGQLGWRGRGRAAVTLGLSAMALWTEPVLRSIQLGQIELVLMALIAWDLCQPDGRRWKGIGIGIAAGIKLVPLLFIPYLLLAGKRRQAAVAAAAFAATVVIGFVILPHESATFWLTGYFLHAGNFTNLSLGSWLNQSLRGLVIRTGVSASMVIPLWLAAAALVAALGLTAAALLARAGRPTAGWVTCALTGMLVSPISWDNHWVWIVPLLVIFADMALRARGPARWAYWAATVVLAAVFADWPADWTGRRAFVPHGLIGFFSHPHGRLVIFHLHGLQLITWNIFVVTGLVALALVAAAAAHTWRDRRGTGGLLSGRTGERAAGLSSQGRATMPAAVTARRAGGSGGAPGRQRFRRRGDDRADGQAAGAADLATRSGRAAR
jgi:alpha-1,2-mannosyltransferase